VNHPKGIVKGRTGVSKQKTVILLVACFLFAGLRPAVAGNSFCKDWGKASPATQADLLNGATEALVDRGLRAIPGLLECVKRNMLIQRPAISKVCKEAPSDPDFTVGVFIGQLSSWIGISCGNDPAFTSTPRVQ
jgi:hypothetical protein